MAQGTGHEAPGRAGPWTGAGGDVAARGGNVGHGLAATGPCDPAPKLRPPASRRLREARSCRRPSGHRDVVGGIEIAPLAHPPPRALRAVRTRHERGSVTHGLTPGSAIAAVAQDPAPLVPDLPSPHGQSPAGLGVRVVVTAPAADGSGYRQPTASTGAARAEQPLGLTDSAGLPGPIGIEGIESRAVGLVEPTALTQAEPAPVTARRACDKRCRTNLRQPGSAGLTVSAQRLQFRSSVGELCREKGVGCVMAAPGAARCVGRQRASMAARHVLVSVRAKPERHQNLLGL